MFKEMCWVDPRTKLYSLIGRGIGYTLSPTIHNYVFRRVGVNAIYIAFDLSEEVFEKAVLGLLELCGGINVTIPYKERIISYLDRLDRIASRIGAVNTIYRRAGYNTDYEAVKSLTMERIGGLEGSGCLVIGAGGAAKASSFALGDLGCRIDIVNRTRKRAEELVERLRSGGIEARAVERCTGTYDVVVNATPDPSSLACTCTPKILAIDLVYRPVKTELIRKTIEMGVRYITGLEILVRQALLAQGIWFERDLLYLEREVIGKLCQETLSGEC